MICRRYRCLPSQAAREPLTIFRHLILVGMLEDAGLLPPDTPLMGM